MIYLISIIRNHHIYGTVCFLYTVQYHTVYDISPSSVSFMIYDIYEDIILYFYSIIRNGQQQQKQNHIDPIERGAFSPLHRLAWTLLLTVQG